jgi:hypothetical protein
MPNGVSFDLMQAGKGTYGICSGGELCTPANGCPSCDHSTGLDWCVRTIQQIQIRFR